MCPSWPRSRARPSAAASSWRSPATGAMILGTALDLLEERNLSTALITLCIGGGMGTATIIERV